MASEVDFCNLALAHIGDRATVASINPPEGSAQSEHCSRFYPIARDCLLEMHDWVFATRRAVGAPVASPASGWLYAYTLPANCLKVRAVLPADAPDDYTIGFSGQTPELLPSPGGQTIPADFAIESLSTGTVVILTNQADAVIRFTARVTDTTKFSPLFGYCLSWFLASMLAGPVLKGDQGKAEAKRCLEAMSMFLTQGKLSDGNQHQKDIHQSVSWMAARG